MLETVDRKNPKTFVDFSMETISNIRVNTIQVIICFGRSDTIELFTHEKKTIND